MSRIIFVKTTIERLKPLVTFAFEDDPELLSKYSKLITATTNPTLEESVNQNIEDIKEALNSPVYCNGDDIHLYEIQLLDGKEIKSIGFMVTVINGDIPHDLFSFGINVHFRTRKIVTKWLQGVKDLLGKYYTVQLHKNNTRAIDLFVKNGFTATTVKGNDILVNTVTLFSNYKDLIKIKEKQNNTNSWPLASQRLQLAQV